MAQASRAKRKLRRLKRENTLVYRTMDKLIIERNMYLGLLQQLYQQAKEAEAKAAAPTIITTDAHE